MSLDEDATSREAIRANPVGYREGGGGGRKALCACGMVRDAEIVMAPGRGETGKLDVDGSLDGRRPGFPSLIFVVVEDASGVGCETEWTYDRWWRWEGSCLETGHTADGRWMVSFFSSIPILLFFFSIPRWISMSKLQRFFIETCHSRNLLAAGQQCHCPLPYHVPPWMSLTLSHTIG